jgi:hypothetical protein
MYCFVEITKFDIPTNPATYPKDLPRYMKNIFKVFNLVTYGSQVLTNYITNYDDYSSDESNFDYDDGALSPPYISTQKSTTKRKGIATANNTSRKKQKSKAS